MPSNDEPVRHAVKHYKPCPAMKNQHGKWNNTNNPKYELTSEAWIETIQLCPLRRKQLSMQWNIFTLHASLVRQNWKWFILLHLKHHWFIITEHGSFVLFDYALHGFFLTGGGLYCFSSCFIGSSLLFMICVVSRHASPVHPYWAWTMLSKEELMRHEMKH
jgi:hypothetical protein